jgi:hypothetical protein
MREKFWIASMVVPVSSYYQTLHLEIFLTLAQNYKKKKNGE